MGRYLRAAFWISPRLPGLGRIPVNALGFAGLLILGFGHPGFWFVAGALEGLWLLAASSSDRFRALIDAGTEALEQGTSEDHRQALVAGLPPESRARLGMQEKKVTRALALQREHGVSPVLQELNADALGKLTWFHLKLLVARQNLLTLGDATTRRDLQERVAATSRELEGRVSIALRESKQATLKILQQRLAHLDRREESLAEIESDLTRIEAQLDLAVESAGLQGNDAAITADIHFVSQFLDPSIYGPASASIAALDETYREPTPRKVAE